MVKKVKKRKIRKEKKKKFIKILKKEVQKDSKLEKEIKELKEKKSKDRGEEIREEPVTNLEISLTDVKAPVLERVAISEDAIDLEEQLSNVQTQQSQSTEKAGTNYAETALTGDYFSGGERARAENKYVQTGSTDYNTMFEETKVTEESRRLLTGGDNSRYQQRERENDSGMERQTFIQGDKESRKYISKGDVK